MIDGCEIERKTIAPPMTIDEVTDWLADYCLQNIAMVSNSDKVVSHALWYIEQLQDRVVALEVAIKKHQRV